jgi:hypothetical protein
MTRAIRIEIWQDAGTWYDTSFLDTMWDKYMYMNDMKAFDVTGHLARLLYLLGVEPRDA